MFSVQKHSSVADLCMILFFRYKYLPRLEWITEFLCVQQSPRTISNGLKLYIAHCTINARKTFLANRIIDVWKSLPETVVVHSHNVSIVKRRFAKFNNKSMNLCAMDS